MKIRLSLFVLPLSIFILNSCSKKKPFIDDIYDNYNGKYELVSAVSNQLVDINMDGIESTELLNELPDLENYWLEIRILESVNYNLLDQMWPEQSVNYDADPNNPTIYYNLRSLPLPFNFNKDFSKIIPETSKHEGNGSYVVPDSIDILNDNNIKIQFTKKFFTSEGWKELIVVAVYKRFTTNT